jgi:hypothetical protein
MREEKNRRLYGNIYGEEGVKMLKHLDSRRG